MPKQRGFYETGSVPNVGNALAIEHPEPASLELIARLKQRNISATTAYLREHGALDAVDRFDAVFEHLPPRYPSNWNAFLEYIKRAAAKGHTGDET